MVLSSLESGAGAGRPEVWLWTELIGFDNEQADYGVAQYLNDAGFVPSSVSLLMFTADFVHTHDGLDHEREFPPDFCSYDARPYSDQRARQAWTSFQLRGLVRELQKYGIEVYFSVFNVYSRYSEWAKHHPEILETARTGQKLGAINILRRLADGTPYEEFFVNQVGRLLDDYGFDGFHAADGYSSPRNPISEIDYSDDMVSQFAIGMGLELPPEFSVPCEQDPALIERRAEWIWKNKRVEWIQYYAGRWQQYCRRLVETVHCRGKKVVLNSAWTRDPFEALYRYGIDYKRMAETGVDGIVVETVAPSAGVYGLDMSAAHHSYAAMMMLIKAYVPNVKLVNLCCIKDTLEQWDALRHHPTVLERDTYGLANLYVYSEQGMLHRCTSGPVGCLCDSILPHEWKWLRETWSVAYQPVPARLKSVTLVWSDVAHRAFLSRFIETRVWSVHKLLYELMRRGAPILAVANADQLHRIQGPVLVIYPELFSEIELRAIQAHKGPVIMIGTDIPSSRSPDVFIRDTQGSHNLICAAWGTAKAQSRASVVDDQGQVEEFEDVSDVKEPNSWLYELFFRKVSDGFLQTCADLAIDLAESPKVEANSPAIKVVATEVKDGSLRLFVSNDATHYNVAVVDVADTIKRVDVVTRYPGTPVSPVGSRIRVRVPAGGMVILDVLTQSGE